jgi:hypothetical protein
MAQIGSKKWLALAHNVSQHGYDKSYQQLRLLSVALNDSRAVSDIKPQGHEDNIKMKKED